MRKIIDFSVEKIFEKQGEYINVIGHFETEPRRYDIYLVYNFKKIRKPNLLTHTNICRVSNKIPYIVILFLSFIAPEGYKIIICHSEDYIHEKEFKLNCNGYIQEKIDNLPNVFRQKHILKVPNKPDFSFTTSFT